MYITNIVVATQMYHINTTCIMFMTFKYNYVVLLHLSLGGIL